MKQQILLCDALPKRVRSANSALRTSSLGMTAQRWESGVEPPHSKKAGCQAEARRYKRELWC